MAAQDPITNGQTLNLWEALSPSLPVDTSTTPYNANFSELVKMDASGGTKEVILPLASQEDRKVAVKKMDSSGNIVEVKPQGAETIDGEICINVTTQYQVVTFCSDGTNWTIV